MGLETSPSPAPLLFPSRSTFLLSSLVSVSPISGSDTSVLVLCRCYFCYLRPLVASRPLGQQRRCRATAGKLDLRAGDRSPRCTRATRLDDLLLAYIHTYRFILEEVTACYFSTTDNKFFQVKINNFIGNVIYISSTRDLRINILLRLHDARVRAKHIQAHIT